MHVPFSKGDHIEVTCMDKNQGTTWDFGVIRGTALDSRGTTGEAKFSLELNAPGLGQQVLTFNLNYVNVKLLHDAYVARDHS